MPSCRILISQRSHKLARVDVEVQCAFLSTGHDGRYLKPVEQSELRPHGCIPVEVSGVSDRVIHSARNGGILAALNSELIQSPVKHGYLLKLRGVLRNGLLLAELNFYGESMYSLRCKSVVRVSSAISGIEPHSGLETGYSAISRNVDVLEKCLNVLYLDIHERAEYVSHQV